MRRLQGKVALVTGAARGVGAAIAEALVVAGAQLLLTDIDDAAGRAAATRLGVGWMPLDVLVNSAGIASPAQGAAHDPEHMSLADWQALHRRPLDGLFHGCKHGLRAMRRSGRRGVILNLAPCPGRAAVRLHSHHVAHDAAAQGLALGCHALPVGTGVSAADVAARAVQLAVAGFSRTTATPDPAGAGRA